MQIHTIHRFSRAKCFLPLIFSTLCLFQMHLHSQGVIVLANGTPGFFLDAPVSFLDGTPVSSGFTAQFYGGPGGTPLGALSPILPTTTFNPNLPGYVLGVIVIVPDVVGRGTFVMRAYDGETWETSLCRGESNPITLNLNFQPATPLGLQPFQVNCIPEPWLFALVVVGTAVLLVTGWRRPLAPKTRRAP
jgi:hypothetical protein